jgi:hypothetical protein
MRGTVSLLPLCGWLTSGHSLSKDVGIAFPTVLEGLPEETVPSASLFLANQLEAVGVACADNRVKGAREL